MPELIGASRDLLIAAAGLVIRSITYELRNPHLVETPCLLIGLHSYSHWMSD